jgi:hypothetical protein
MVPAAVDMARSPRPGKTACAATVESAAPRTFVLYNVTYEDGTRSSNRKVARELVNGLEGDSAVKASLEAQDRDIAETSGMPRGPINRIERVPE